MGVYLEPIHLSQDNSTTKSYLTTGKLSTNRYKSLIPFSKKVTQTLFGKAKDDFKQPTSVSFNIYDEKEATKYIDRGAYSNLLKDVGSQHSGSLR